MYFFHTVKFISVYCFLQAEPDIFSELHGAANGDLRTALRLLRNSKTVLKI